MSSYTLARWLQSRGHELGVLTTAKSPEDVLDGVMVDGIQTFRVWMPRLYPMYDFASAPGWQKPIWHAQDHFDPRNRQVMARVLDAFRPDFVNIHLVQGLGHNSLVEISRRDIPAMYFLHDLGLACMRMSMFRGGQECVGQCKDCALSTAWKERQLQTFDRLGFCSPSAANLDNVGKYVDIARRPKKAIANLQNNPVPTIARSESADFRILYIGRLHSTKGIQLLLAACAALAARFPLKLSILGSGPDEAALREQYGHHPWCDFRGFVSAQDIANEMVNSELYCIPSVWREPYGRSVAQALACGLPVVGSNTGGIAEMVQHDQNGLLVEPGNLSSLQNALETAMADPERLARWRQFALANAAEFDPEQLGERILAHIEYVRDTRQRERA